jgi:hypothetical protein
MRMAAAPGWLLQLQLRCCRLDGWQRCTPAQAPCCCRAISFARLLQRRLLRLPSLPPWTMKLRLAP